MLMMADGDGESRSLVIEYTVIGFKEDVPKAA
jgi:hypothetical protein